jgi:predicted nuclease of predicted toxin-antitoxin system
MPNAVADGLLRRGFDVTTSLQSGLLGASDEDELAFALSQNRFIITRDQDLLRLNAKGIEHAGILFWTQQQRNIGQLIRAIDALLINVDVENIKGRVFYL